ncbi:MAG: AAA family ATPase [Treponema sp.]|nr:AAA family ATPase [Treponema sp.]
MFLEKIKVKNFRLLRNVTIELDCSTTLIVGKNNSGKTSLMDFMSLVLDNKNPSFDDYPIQCRCELYKSISSLLKKELTYETFLNKLDLPEMSFYIDYSLEKDDDNLGALSPFIIDTDESITQVHILAKYEPVLSEENIFEVYSSVKTDEDGKINIEKIKQITRDQFPDFFKLTVYAVNPGNENLKQKNTSEELSNLFPVYKIVAERGMDESEQKNNAPLAKLLTLLFKDNIDESLEGVNGEIRQLKQICSEVETKSQDTVNKLLQEIVSKSFVFGYPSAEDLKLIAVSKIALDEQVKANANLAYEEKNSSEFLPSTYNGLGYKNLIKIELKLVEFSKAIKENEENSIPLLFLEEPESHMHPQLQQKFIEYLASFFKSISIKQIQTIITTHSSHIVNAVKFDQIRYIQKKKQDVAYKNVKDFSLADPDNADFIQKYLTLNKCDLFFADKAILIEGTAERLLIPDMIDKCESAGKFGTTKQNLKSQYYSLIEVGGAYAHKFIPFMKFLGIPTLILTDIDSVGTDGKKSFVKDGKSTSNATINDWLKRLNESKSFENIKNLDSQKKTIGNCHIEYQIAEDDLCGRSLEESIKNVNRSLFSVPPNPSEEDIEFKEGKKTDFALNLLIEKKNYIVPKYIEQGLIWLNSQKTIIGE